MKTRLDQLTLKELIELSCGDYTVLCENDELLVDSDVLPKVKAILSEYKSIASPTQARVELMDSEKLSKFQMKEKCARICILLCAHGRHDLAREVLLQLGIEERHIASDEAVMERCQAIIGEVKYETERIAERKAKKVKSRSAEQTRREWYGEIASVMGVFHMNIDPSHTNAAIYANLVHQAVERSKAIAKMPPSARMFMRIA
ncbi:MAG: hypothetical protein ACSW8D_07130 [Prevotella sp.]